MSSALFSLDVVDGRARAGRLLLPQGEVETPVFMPVGTLGSVKGLAPEELADAGSDILLANTYHLYLRPGAEVVSKLGGINNFMRWQGPVLTDSGGFQVFSLAKVRQIENSGVTFRSHIDGSEHHLTPERIIDIQRLLGADIIMAFDECPPAGVSHERARASVRRSQEWLRRCQERFARPTIAPTKSQSLLPVLQGSVYDDLRAEHLRQVMELNDWPGYAIGGLSVGEAKADMWRTMELLDGLIPTSRPRYLMGVGYPDDILEAITRGCDMFDCVAPTRNGRHGTAWTEDGQLNLKGARFRLDPKPIDPGCACYACQKYDRAYVRHLLVAGERLAHRLVSLHNIAFLHQLVRESRLQIEAGTFNFWAQNWLERYRS